MFNTKVRLLLIAFILFSSIFANPAPAWGCSCVDPRAPEEAFISADAVFVGTVTGTGDGFWNQLSVRFVGFYHQFVPPLPRTMVTGLYERPIEFDVETSWRGVETTQITVRTGWGGGDCGYNFQQSKQYLVYAHQSSDGAFHTSFCSRTAPLASATEELNQLQTVPKLELTDSPLMFNFQMLCLVIPLLGVIGLGVLIWRRRTRIAINGY
ncbi:MAG: hypothetical protein ACPGWR_14980 [Ardenticatenaceae bacterium]